MKTYAARVVQLELDAQGRQAAWVECPAGAVPEAGQVLMASPILAESGSPEPLATALFPGGWNERGFLGLPLEAHLPAAWLPGAALLLRGPLGQGFRLPGNLRRLGLAAVGETAARLLPLAERGLALGADIVLFGHQIPAALPATVEFLPLSALPETLGWMDFLALDLPREALPNLRKLLQQEEGRPLSCPAQALVTSPLPCGGMAGCGACAVPARHGWNLICEDGPVFDLRELDW